MMVSHSTKGYDGWCICRSYSTVVKKEWNKNKASEIRLSSLLVKGVAAEVFAHHDSFFQEAHPAQVLRPAVVQLGTQSNWIERYEQTCAFSRTQQRSILAIQFALASKSSQPNYPPNAFPSHC